MANPQGELKGNNSNVSGPSLSREGYQHLLSTLEKILSRNVPLVLVIKEKKWDTFSCASKLN